MIIPSGEAKLYNVGCNGKQLLWVKKMLKKCNMGQDVMTFGFNIFESLDAVNFEKRVCVYDSQ